jgi:hypothetical protein
MEETIIYGASDDLIEISGHFSEELSVDPSDDDVQVLAISDGTLLEVQYDSDGQWLFRPLTQGSAFSRVVIAVGEDTNHQEPYSRISSYSDIVVFKPEIKWVAFSERFARLK